jgi:SlyX protein
LIEESGDVEDRLIELEARMAHYERMLEDMSGVIARQDQSIDRLASRLKRLQERVRDLASGDQASPSDERPPPHY